MRVEERKRDRMIVGVEIGGNIILTMTMLI